MLTTDSLGGVRYMTIDKNKDVSQNKIDGDVFLYNEELNKLVCLNKTASIIWELIDGSEKHMIEKDFLSGFDFKNEAERVAAKDDFEKVLINLNNSGCINVG